MREYNYSEVKYTSKIFLSIVNFYQMVDGSLGGSFLRRVADYLEQFDPNRAF